MTFSLASLPSRRFSTPERALVESTSRDCSPSEARAKEKHPLNWAKAAVGLGLAAGALAGCTSPTAPALDPGAYAMESPEVVVLSESIQRIDLARETETHCTGMGEDKSCHTHSVAYHPIGIHFGHGLVEDLNGNLYAAPQLISGGDSGVAVKNPDSVLLDGPFLTEGRLNRVDENTVETQNSLFSRHRITLSENQAVVTRPELFGGGHESIRVRVENGVATISENRWDHQIVQSQGDHILVQTPGGSEIAKIRAQRENRSYTVTRPTLFKSYQVDATYDSNSIRFDDNAWGADPSVSKGTDSEGRTTYEKRHGKQHVSTTTVTPDGWIDHTSGLFGGSTSQFIIQGGELPPG